MENKEKKKTGAIIGTVVAALLCGCPGLTGICLAASLPSPVSYQVPRSIFSAAVTPILPSCGASAPCAAA